MNIPSKHNPVRIDSESRKSYLVISNKERDALIKKNCTSDCIKQYPEKFRAMINIARIRHKPDCPAKWYL